MLALFVIVVCYHILAAMPAPTRVYDQRQTGDLNVQVDVKDVRVVALINSELLDDYMDYDYFYDFADFTIKPTDGNRPAASSTTTEKNEITGVSEFFSLQNSTVSVSSDNINSTERIAANSTSNANDNNKDLSSEENSNRPSAAVVVSSNMAKLTQGLRSQKRCKSGYISTGNGRCRQANRPLLWLLP